MQAVSDQPSAVGQPSEAESRQPKAERRWPFHVAGPLAVKFIERLAPLCEPWPDGAACEHWPRFYCTVAGSLRRLKPDVGDIEILYVPRFGMVQRAGELLPAHGNLVDAELEKLLANGTLAKRPNKDGAFTWGEKNKLAVHPASGCPVDFFATTRAAWFNYLVCRTGPKESNVAVCMAAEARGWKWQPYEGFTRGGALTGTPNERYVPTSEREVFEFVGLPYRPPWDRVT